MGQIHICRFDTTMDIPARKLTYELVKQTVLAAGRFSCFEASDTPKRAKLFTMLHDDVELVTDNTRGYPWIYVRPATAEEQEKRRAERKRIADLDADMVLVGKRTMMPRSMVEGLQLKVRKSNG